MDDSEEVPVTTRYSRKKKENNDTGKFYFSFYICFMKY